jgi:SNF2 family DNA or RNA helicase
VLAELSAEGDRIECRTEWRQKELIVRIPGARWDRGSGLWLLPMTWSSCLALRSEFRSDLQIGPRLTDWARTLRTDVIEPALKLREAFDAEGDPDLFPHQRADVAWLSTVERALLANEMGTGKTASVVRGLVELTRRGENVFPALVVCPNSVKRTWKREIERWWPGVVVNLVSGTAVQRRKQLTKRAHVYVLNYEALRSHSRLIGYGDIALRRCVECGGEDPKISVAQCHVHIRELNKIKFATVIADEAHRCKDPTTIQTRALKSAASGARFRIAMTGTPIANNRVDLWSILNFIDPVEWPTKTKWIDRLIDVTYNVFGGIVFSGVKADHQEEFDQTINPRMRRMPKDAVLNLPPILPERRDVLLSPKQQKAYDEMAARMMAEMVGGGLLVTTSPLTQSLRLLQLASSCGEMETRTRKTVVTGKELEALKIAAPGKLTISPTGDSAVFEEEYEKLILSAPSTKIDAFMEDLPDFEGRSIVVFAVSRQLVMLLSEALTRKGIEHGLIIGNQPEWQRDENVQAFQKGHTKIILVTVAAGGTGLTLTAADTVVYLQRSWSLIDMTQSESRAHRIGSEIHSSITRIDYVAPDTMEEIVIASLEGKTVGLQDLVKDKDILAKAVRGQVVEI